MLFAARCAGCGSEGSSPCAGCVDAMVPVGDVPVDGLDGCVALVDYDDLSRRLISQLKYRGVRSAVPWLADAMAARVRESGGIDVVTWIPAARPNRRRRGFDQAEALARPIARRLRLPATRLLARTDRTGQTGARRAARLDGPGLAPVRHPRGRRVLVVDDVLTSGGSMMAAARVLRAAGAPAVRGVVAAHRRFH